MGIRSTLFSKRRIFSAYHNVMANEFLKSYCKCKGKQIRFPKQKVQFR